MNRRDLITAGPLAGLAAALVAGDANAAVVEALSVRERETPVTALFRQWKAAMDDLEQQDGDTPSPEWRAVEGHIRGIEDRLFAEPVTGWADMAMKLCAATGFGVWDANHEAALWVEARALVG